MAQSKGAATVATTVTVIVAANATRGAIILMNTDTDTVWLAFGDDVPVADTGLYLVTNASLKIDSPALVGKRIRGLVAANPSIVTYQEM